MNRQENVIQLSNHVKNKLKQHKYPSASSQFINSSDEFTEINSIDEDNDSLLSTSPENITRTRRDTFTTYHVKKPSEFFFTDRKPYQNPNISVLQEEYEKQKQCQSCIHRDRIIHYERQRLLHFYNENKKLNEQLRSSILLNQQYEDNIQKLKNHLTKINSHLYEYQSNFDYLKQKIVSEKKPNSKIDDEEDKQDMTNDHLKRLRYEIQMYNRIVAAKQEQKTKPKQIDFLF